MDRMKSTERAEILLRRAVSTKSASFWSDMFPKVSKGTVWTGVQSRMLLTDAGLKVKLCTEPREVSGTRKGR